MPGIGMLAAICREIFGSREFPREPEPDLVMTDQSQVLAYETAGRTDGVMAASYLFHAARISMVIQNATNIIDLACGPATQLALVAELNPAISFVGIDYSETMLKSAEAHINEKKLDNVVFEQGDISSLAQIPTHSADGIISTMALHHLPTFALLEQCFREIQRILKPGGALYLVDFGRLKQLKSVLYFAYMNRKHQPHIFSLDYERSLRASFLSEDLFGLAKSYLPDYECISTSLVPLLIIIKSPDSKIDQETQKRVKAAREALSPKYRRILDDMRLFLRIGGMKNDPFK